MQEPALLAKPMFHATRLPYPYRALRERDGSPPARSWGIEAWHLLKIPAAHIQPGQQRGQVEQALGDDVTHAVL